MGEEEGTNAEETVLCVVRKLVASSDEIAEPPPSDIKRPKEERKKNEVVREVWTKKLVPCEKKRRRKPRRKMVRATTGRLESEQKRKREALESNPVKTVGHKEEGPSKRAKGEVEAAKPDPRRTDMVAIPEKAESPVKSHEKKAERKKG